MASLSHLISGDSVDLGRSKAARNPNGLTAIGYTERDLPALIEGTLRQPRLLSGAPRHVGAAELDLILRDAMQYW
jgi:hypothetical protein